MTVHVYTRKGTIVLYIIVLTLLQEIDTNEVSKGGPCISFAQSKCQNEGSNLWTVIYDKQLDKVCRLFELYHKCIVNHMKKCNYQAHERQLHQSDIVNHYTGPPFNCPPPTIGFESSAKQGKTNKSNRLNFHKTILCVMFFLHKIYHI